MVKASKSTPSTPTSYPTGSQQGKPTMSNQLSSLEDILSADPETFEAPPPVPGGTYTAMVDGPHQTGESSQQKTPYIRVKFKLLSAEDDVDQAELQAAEVLGRTMNYDLYVTKDAAFRIKDFLKHLGVAGGRPLTEALADIQGKTCKVYVQQESITDKQTNEVRLLSRIRSTSGE